MLRKHQLVHDRLVENEMSKTLGLNQSESSTQNCLLLSLSIFKQNDVCTGFDATGLFFNLIC